MVTENKRLELTHSHEVQEVLRKWLTPSNMVICETIARGEKTDGGAVIGYGKKFVNRGGINHKLAGTYFDFTKLRLVRTDGSEFEYHSDLSASPHKDIQELARKVGNLWVRMCDLPEMLFWEGDIVKILDPHHNSVSWLVRNVDYNVNGRHYCYLKSVALFADTHSHCQRYTSELELVSRGNLWKMEHGEPMEFADIYTEAKFYQSLGTSDKVTHVRHRGMVGEIKETVDTWEFKDAVAALQRGDADQMKPKDKKYLTFVLIKYDVPKVPDFGERMRAHELNRLWFGQKEPA